MAAGSGDDQLDPYLNDLGEEFGGRFADVHFFVDHDAGMALAESLGGPGNAESAEGRHPRDAFTPCEGQVPSRSSAGRPRRRGS